MGCACQAATTSQPSIAHRTSTTILQGKFAFEFTFAVCDKQKQPRMILKRLQVLTHTD